MTDLELDLGEFKKSLITKAISFANEMSSREGQYAYEYFSASQGALGAEKEEYLKEYDNHNFACNRLKGISRTLQNLLKELDDITNYMK